MLDDQSWRFGAKESDIEFYKRLLPAEHPLLDAMQAVHWDGFTELLESYYCPDKGQPAVPPLLLLKLEFLRYFFRLSDREVLRRSQTDILFRYFLQIPVRCRLPQPTILVSFRGRLGPEGFKRVFDQLVAGARQAGLVRDRLRLKDASHVLAKIAVPSKLKLLAQLRERMLTEVERIYPELAVGYRIEIDRIRQETEHAEGAVRVEQRVNLLQEILELLQQHPEPPDSDGDASWLQLQKLCRLATKVLGDTAHLQAGDRVRSIVDPEARRSKHGQWYDGYTIDISMDADSQIITCVDVLTAGGDEAQSAVNLVASEQLAHGNQIESLSIDGVGFNGPMLRTLEGPGGLGVTVYTPTRESSNGGVFGVEQFEVSADGQRVVCPGGQCSGSRQRDDARHRTYFQFDRQSCAACPWMSQCKPVLGKGRSGGRGVTKNDYEAEHQRARVRTQSAEYAAVRREHPAIERKLNEVVRHHGGRFAKYWGKGKVKAQELMTCFAVNVKRIARLQGEMLCAQPT
jgi:transposase